jgi:nucleoside-diphosphate-sugar epimerase
MERRLYDYAQRGGRVLIVRAGDFFGPRTANSWFSQGLVRPGSPITKVYDPGRPGMGHAWSYVPDVARCARAEPKIKAFSWWLLTALALFVSTFREMGEMRYLWRVPLRLDNSRLEAVLGREPHTPLDEAVEATLQGLGCLKVARTSGALQR